eukprot:gene8381-206_t
MTDINEKLNFFILDSDTQIGDPENLLLEDSSVWESSKENNSTISFSLHEEEQEQEKEEEEEALEEEKEEELISIESKPSAFILKELEVVVPKNSKNSVSTGLLWVMNEKPDFKLLASFDFCTEKIFKSLKHESESEPVLFFEMKKEKQTFKLEKPAIGRYLIIKCIESIGDKTEIQQLNFIGSVVPKEQFIKVGGKKTIFDLISSLKLTLNDKKYSDLTITIGKKQFYCHKLILSQCSKLNLNQSEIKVENIEEVVFSKILDFLYTGSIEVSKDNNDIYLKSANILGCQPLSLTCFEFLSNSNQSNICQLLMDGKNGKFGEVDVDGLVNKCVKVISKKCEEIFKSDDFLNLDSEVILSILKSSDIDIDELSIFNAIIKWGKNQQKKTNKELNEILKDLILQVRLPLISSEDLIKIVKPTKLVPFDSYLHALEYHVAPEDVKPIGIQFKARGSNSTKFKWDITTGGNQQCFTLSNSNLTVKKISGGSTWNNAMIYGNKPLKSGKHYYELKLDHTASDKSGFAIGLSKDKKLKQKYSKDMVIGMSGYQYNLSGTNGSSNKAGDVIGVLVDFGRSKVYFFINGKKCGSEGLLQSGTEYWPCVHLYYVNDQTTLSFPSTIPKV